MPPSSGRGLLKKPVKMTGGTSYVCAKLIVGARNRQAKSRNPRICMRITATPSRRRRSQPRNLDAMACFLPREGRHRLLVHELDLSIARVEDYSRRSNGVKTISR